MSMHLYSHVLVEKIRHVTVFLRYFKGSMDLFLIMKLEPVYYSEALDLAQKEMTKGSLLLFVSTIQHNTCFFL